ncbi:MAG: DUF58 domain-containing protein [Planctomycetaceae bacterium]
MNSDVKPSRQTPLQPGMLSRVGQMLSIDFCPSFNRWVYWMKNPFWVLVLAVVGSVLCGVFLNPWIFTLTALLLLVVGVGTVLPWVAMRGISCQVLFDVRRVRFGEAALVRLRIQNRWPLPVWGLSLINGFTSRELSEDRQLNHGSEGIAFARVPGWSTMEYTWSFVAKQRGLYPTNGRAEVETSFPFGLFRARRHSEVQGQLIVWPETTSLIGMPDVGEAQTADDASSDRRVGDFGDVLGTRPFREGDSLRRVHWAQTARQQSLIVTERQAPLTTSVRIVLDVSPRSHPPKIREATVEHCVRVAASLCDSLHRQHCRVELQIGDRLFVVGNSAAGLHRAMDALAVLDADELGIAVKADRSGRGSDFTITVTPADNAVPGRRRQILVSDADDAGTRASAWIQLNAGQPLSELATAWRKVCHCLKSIRTVVESKASQRHGETIGRPERCFHHFASADHQSPATRHLRDRHTDRRRHFHADRTR